MAIILTETSPAKLWLRRLVIALTLILLVISSLILTTMYDIERPSNGIWRKDPGGAGEIRDVGFANLLAQTGVRDPDQVVLKVFLGWSQNVWIAVLDRLGAEPEVQLNEWDFRTGKNEMRNIALSRSELNDFLAKFDRVALGFRIAETGWYDGREISFERHLPGRIVSYEGNASFSKQDAEMAKVVDKFIATHGGYKFIRPSGSGQDF